MRKRKQPEEWAARLGTSALNPLQAMDLQDAVRKREIRVQLEDRWFTLTYLEDGKTLLYKPEIGYAPMGYLNIERLIGKEG